MDEWNAISDRMWVGKSNLLVSLVVRILSAGVAFRRWRRRYYRRIAERLLHHLQL